jgi:hypothetical protein
MKTKILFLLIILVLTAFAGCSKESITCSDGRVVDDINKCVISTNNDNLEDGNGGGSLTNIINNEPIVEGDVVTFFNSDKFQYMGRTSEPKDSIIKNANKIYEMFGEVTYTFSNTKLLSEKKVYMKIAAIHTDTKLNREVYSGELKSGTNTLKLNAETSHLSENPRLMFCFDTKSDFDMFAYGTVCVKKGYAAPKPAMAISLHTLNYNLNADKDGSWIKLMQKTTLENKGDTGQTIYIVPTQHDLFEIKTEYEKVFLEPGAKKDLAIYVNYLDNGSLRYDVTKEVYLYMIPNNCDMSETCATSAYVKDKVLVKVEL